MIVLINGRKKKVADKLGAALVKMGKAELVVPEPAKAFEPEPKTEPKKKQKKIIDLDAGEDI